MADYIGDTIVIENGSWMIKAGFCNSDAPRTVFPPVVGVPRTPSGLKEGMKGSGAYVGDEALAKRGILDLSYAIERGIVTDFDKMERVWHHVFQEELRVDSSEHPALLTESPLNPKANREKTTEIMFESLQVPSLCLAVDDMLSLYASGRSSGVVLHCGAEETRTVPIYEGHALAHAVRSSDELGGEQLTDHLLRLFSERGVSFSTEAPHEIVNHIKELLCFVALDYEREMQSFATTPSSCEQTYELPDGQLLCVGAERFRCPEALFQPSLLGAECDSVHEMLYKTLRSCGDEELLGAEMCRNVMLAGGSTLFAGMAERLQRNLEQLGVRPEQSRVLAPPERKYSAWIGGALLTSLSSSLMGGNSFMISKEQYEEHGSSVVHKVCF
mmetsp:Transcript_27095/g.68057  ORF Transcript_27095/g.68057 Transcript_27095/m.68057 type:complete len:386 (-) Transcript_27095:51-1208(-)